jgi:ApbE superfamily uncharacterized protein (UPF0280 family)
MDQYTDRTYRRAVTAKDLVGFEIRVRETDLWIGADRDLEIEARDLVVNAREQVESYINSHPEFMTTLTPCADNPLAPPIVTQMIKASRVAGVGPMAAVAGTIAEFVGQGLLNSSSQVIVENGGDIFFSLKRRLTMKIFAGKSPLSERLGLEIPVDQMPLGVCSSSGTIGHSLSLGMADAVCVTSTSAALADAVATALGNRIKTVKDLEPAARWIAGIERVNGAVIIIGKSMAAWGDVELVEL